VVPKLGAAADLRNDAFSLTQDHPLGTKVYAAGNDAVVMALKERIAADPAGLADAKDTLKTTLLQQKQQDAVQAFMNHLKERARQQGALEVKTDVVAEG
jgi:hypothetical protein